MKERFLSEVRNVPLTLILTVILWTFFSGINGLESFFLQMITAVIMLVVMLRWGIAAMVVSRIFLHYLIKVICRVRTPE